MSRFTPSDSKQVSKDAAVFLSRILSSVPCKDGKETGRRGFAVQAVTNEHLKLLWPDDVRPFITAALCSAMIDHAKKDQDIRSKLAGWLDDVVALGVGQEAANEWLGTRAKTVASATATVGGLAALGRPAAPAAPAATPAPAVTPAPAAPAVDVATMVAQAVAAAMAQVQEAHAAQMAALMAQQAQLLAAATTAKPSRKKATTVVVAPASDAGESSEV
jgi:hypothetical protein